MKRAASRISDLLLPNIGGNWQRGASREAVMVQIVTVKEVAAFLKLKEATVCSLAAEGKLPGFKLGKSWRFDMDEMEKWISGMPRSGMGKLEQEHGQREGGVL